MSKQTIINEGGITGTGEGLVNQNSQSFKELQRLIQERAGRQHAYERIQNQLLSLRLQMQSYLNDEHPKEMIQAGRFLEAFVEVLNIKKKTLAEYIGYKESNLSAVLKGNRKINTDLAIKLGELFGVDPALWLHIQSKNELLEILGKDRSKYEGYTWRDLLKKVG